jgi:hypothetical protein
MLIGQVRINLTANVLSALLGLASVFVFTRLFSPHDYGAERLSVRSGHAQVGTGRRSARIDGIGQLWRNAHCVALTLVSLIYATVVGGLIYLTAQFTLDSMSPRSGVSRRLGCCVAEMPDR